MIPCPPSKTCFPGVDRCYKEEERSDPDWAESTNLIRGGESGEESGDQEVECGPCPEGFRKEEGKEWCRPRCKVACSVGYWCSAPDTCTGEMET